MYTLMLQKNENCVHDPEPFGVEAHGNVFIIVEDMNQVLVIYRIPRKNMINVLSNDLMGDAIYCILYCENTEDALVGIH